MGIEEAEEIRRCIVPYSNEDQIISIDFANIEYRLLAHFCEDPTLLKIFRSGQDFHSMVAKALFGEAKLIEDIKKNRDLAKTFNFAQLYGASPKRLSEQTKLSLKACKRAVGKYHLAYPGVSAWIQGVESYARREKGIRNIFGRWREIPKDMEYIAPNTLIQSTAADMLKIAMLKVREFLRNKKSTILFPVHDEININRVKTDGDIVFPIVALMTSFLNKKGRDIFRVPITADVSICDDNYGDKRDTDVWDVLDFIMGHEAAQKEVILNVKSNPAKGPYIHYMTGCMFGDVNGLEFTEKIFKFACAIDTIVDQGRNVKKFTTLWSQKHGVTINAAELHKLPG